MVRAQAQNSRTAEYRHAPVGAGGNHLHAKDAGALLPTACSPGLSTDCQSPSLCLIPPPVGDGGELSFGHGCSLPTPIEVDVV